MTAIHEFTAFLTDRKDKKQIRYYFGFLINL